MANDAYTAFRSRLQELYPYADELKNLNPDYERNIVTRMDIQNAHNLANMLYQMRGLVPDWGISNLGGTLEFLDYVEEHQKFITPMVSKPYEFLPGKESSCAYRLHLLTPLFGEVGWERCKPKKVF